MRFLSSEARTLRKKEGRLYNLYRREGIIPPKSNEISSPSAFPGGEGIKCYAFKILVKKSNKRPTPIFFFSCFFSSSSSSSSSSSPFSLPIYPLVDVNTMDKAKMGGACL